MKVVIVTTPNENMKETGFGSTIACRSVLKSIAELGHNVKLKVCKSKSNLDKIIKIKPDLVVLAVKYIVLENGNSIWVSDYFDKHGINYTGSSKAILDFDSNKILAKTHLMERGVRTAKFLPQLQDNIEVKEICLLNFLCS